MKVAIVSTYDLDGGAARAAYRLHRALSSAGVTSRMFVQEQSSSEPDVDGPRSPWKKLSAQLRAKVDQLPSQLLGVRRGDLSLNWLRSGLVQRLEAFKPDVVHLHWVNDGFVSLSELSALSALGRAVVLTAHDMWSFTGGCHYDGECGRYAGAGCLGCPLQPNSRFVDLPVARYRTKTRVYHGSRVTFVCPSRWLAGVARSSAVSVGRPVHTIANGLDLDVFKPVDRQFARGLFNLPDDRIVLLFGAMNAQSDPRKGYIHLDEALRLLAGSQVAASLMLVVFGSAQRRRIERHGLPVIEVGRLHDDESLTALYSAADLFVAPSLQDNLPNTVVEATACGLPTVAFDIGGMPDIVEHGTTGWLVPPGDAGALAERLEFAAEDAVWRRRAAIAARELALQRFSATAFARAHLGIYQAAIREQRPRE